MRDSQVSPLLPKWPFYLANSLLVLFAIFIAFQSRENLSATPIFWCICSVFLGSVFFVYPFLQEFKAYVSLQKSRNTALTKEQAQQLVHTLYQLQEMKESIFQNHHKQSLDQNLISSTLQSLEERLNIILDKNSNQPDLIYPVQTSLDSLEAKLQSLLDTLSLNASVQEPFVKEPVGSQPIRTEGLTQESNEPLSLFFRPYSAVPSLEGLETSTASPLDETIQALYPEDEEEKVKRNLFSEEKESLSSQGEHSFAFDFDNLVPQNLFSPRDTSSLDLNVSEEPSSLFISAPSIDTPLSSHFPVEEKKQPEQEASVAVEEYHFSQDQIYNPAQGTGLIVHANLGIGKKPYIRGQGPGLNWGYGVPMAFIEMGKWQWTAPDSSQPIICRIYKNDEVPAEGEVLCLQPGEQVELSPVFGG